MHGRASQERLTWFSRFVFWEGRSGTDPPFFVGWVREAANRISVLHVRPTGRANDVVAAVLVSNRATEYWSRYLGPDRSRAIAASLFEQGPVEIDAHKSRGRHDENRAGHMLPANGQLAPILPDAPRRPVTALRRTTPAACQAASPGVARRASQPPHPPGRRTVNEDGAPYPGSRRAQVCTARTRLLQSPEIPESLRAVMSDDRLSERYASLGTCFCGPSAKGLQG